VAEFVAILLFSFGLFFVVKGGGILVESAMSLNKITRLSNVVIGATVVAIATTIPEIVISIFAVLTNHTELATGNTIGGMVVNFALVFGLFALFMPRAVEKRDVLVKGAFIIFVLFLIALFLMDLQIVLWESLVLIGVFFVYLAVSIGGWGFKRRTSSNDFRKQLPLESVGLSVLTRKRIKRQVILGLIGGQILLVAGAFLLVNNGERLASAIGASETFIGFVLLALGTSAPELVTVIVSIRRKKGDIALGNILGSNIINGTLLLGVTGFIGVGASGSLVVSSGTLFVGLPALALVSLICILPMALKNRIYRWQGVALSAVYITYIVLLAVVV